MNTSIPAWLAVMLAACAGGPPASGTGGTTDDRTPLKLVSAELVSADEIELTFSEAIAPPREVDPSDFRLSLARVTPTHVVWRARCFGSFLGSYSNASDCYTHGISWGGCDGDYIRCAQWLLSEPGTAYYGVLPIAELGLKDDRHLVAKVADVTGDAGSICEQLGQAYEETLFLHYAEASPRVEGLDGSALASIAPDWVHPTHDPLRVGGATPEAPLPVATDICSTSP